MIDKSRSRALFEEEQRFIAPGLQSIALLSQLAIAHGSGTNLTDLDGKTYLDLNAGVSVASLGHSHPKYVAALTEQLKRITVGSFSTEPRAELLRLIATLTPGDLNRTQLFSGGAEAVEAAIRLARSYTKRYDIVGFTGGFHGKTAGVLPVSEVDWKKDIGPLAQGYRIAPYPDTSRFNGSVDQCCEEALAALGRELERAPTPAAVLIEPIQGTAGNIIPPDGFLPQALRLAHQHGALLIADEMITGFGRTGKMFACNHDNIVPDIITLGKGMASGYPVSAVVSRDDIVAAEPFSLPSASSSSYGGNPLAAAAALVTIQTIVSDRLTENAARVGRRFLERLAELATRQKEIANVRGRGLLIGFDLVSESDRQPWPRQRCVAFFRECLADGLILMGYSPRVRIHPPLILTEAEADAAVSIIEAALHRTTRT